MERGGEVAYAEGREPKDMAEAQQKLCSAGTASEEILAAEVTGTEMKTLALNSSGHTSTCESFSAGSTGTDLPGADDAGGE